MNVSVEISSFNNKELLRIALDRLAQQTYPPAKFDVVISDDGSTDGLVEMIREISGELPYRLTLLANEHRGGGFAHNTGIRACTGDLVLMLAADILATPELIEDHVRGHMENPGPEVMVVGRLRQSEELPKNAIQQGWNQVVNRLFAEQKEDIQHGGFLVSNISFKKEFMLEHGMFREWPPVAQEDMELGYRLRSSGMRLVQSPGALGYHHHEVSLEGLAKRAYMQGYNYHYLEDNVPDLWIRLKMGHVEPSHGLGVYLKTRMKGGLRRCVLNALTLRAVIIPLLRAAERFEFLRPLVPNLCSKVTFYHFHVGLQDCDAGRAIDLGRVVA